MGFQYYQRHEWWRDDNREHRSRNKIKERDYFYKIALRHGFEANPTRMQYFNQAYIDHTPAIQRLGNSINNWMRVMHPENSSSFFDGQQVLVLGVMSAWNFDLTFRIVTVHLPECFWEYDQVYVLRNDYDWAIQERDCDIADLI